MAILFDVPSIPFWEYMTPKERWASLPDAYRAFMTTKPNPPGHAEYLARAAALYPGLPPGAQQTALHIREVDGIKAAAGYAARAKARWRVKGFRFVVPKPSNAGICTYSVKERDERLARYRAHMAAGAKNLERQRKADRCRLDREIRAAMTKSFPKFSAALAESVRT